MRRPGDRQKRSGWCSQKWEVSKKCGWCVLVSVISPRSVDDFLGEKMKRALRLTTLFPPQITISHPKKLLFLQESWKWKMTILETKLIIQGPVFHWSMIMGGEVGSTGKMMRGKMRSGRNLLKLVILVVPVNRMPGINGRAQNGTLGQQQLGSEKRQQNPWLTCHYTDTEMGVLQWCIRIHI